MPILNTSEATKRSSDRTENSKSTNVTKRRSRIGSQPHFPLILLAWAGDSYRSSEGSLHDGDSSIKTQRVTEVWILLFQSRCIIWLLCLNSLALDTSSSHFLHIKLDKFHTHFESSRQDFCHCQLFQLYRIPEASGGSRIHRPKISRMNFNTSKLLNLLLFSATMASLS